MKIKLFSVVVGVVLIALVGCASAAAKETQQQPAPAPVPAPQSQQIPKLPPVAKIRPDKFDLRLGETYKLCYQLPEAGMYIEVKFEGKTEVINSGVKDKKEDCIEMVAAEPTGTQQVNMFVYTAQRTPVARAMTIFDVRR